MSEDIHRALEAVWRIESAKIIGGLTRMVREVGLAEELAQDALVSALETWPRTGAPENPGAWLMAAAKRRALDRLRRFKMLERKHEEIARELGEQELSAGAEIEAAALDPVGDDVLRLMFIACHPVLSTEARVALTLRLLGGLTTDEIARAFLVSEPAMAQRIVRAKKTLADAGAGFELPSRSELGSRLASVLEVIYLIFNEGYSATRGEDWMRPALCEEALRLGRILQGLMPDRAEVHGLAALMEIQASRSRTRTNAEGDPVLLLDQNRARWDRLLIKRGLDALDRAETLAATRGPYTLQAAIAACHARALAPEATDWPRIVTLYDELGRVAPSPIIELNRAVAVSMADGPAAGLVIVDAIVASRAVDGYPWLPSVRGNLLFKLERFEEAREEFERAASMTANVREQRLLKDRAAGCARSVASV